jgi:hypothetical protein
MDGRMVEEWKIVHAKNISQMIESRRKAKQMHTSAIQWERLNELEDHLSTTTTNATNFFF